MSSHCATLMINCALFTSKKKLCRHFGVGLLSNQELKLCFFFKKHKIKVKGEYGVSVSSDDLFQKMAPLFRKSRKQLTFTDLEMPDRVI